MAFAKTVDICIPSFKGQNLIGELLSSIADLDLDGIRLRVIVVDNDANRSCWPVVSAFDTRNIFELEYVVEARRGISFARNKALDSVQSDYFAFVDDDELVEPEWLQSMLNTLHQYEADFVFGPVQGILPQDACAWARTHPAFSPIRQLTGTRIKIGASGNVLGRIQAVRECGIRFDAAFAETGAEDSDFFHRMYLAGYELVWCDEALVTEIVQPGRIKVSWIRKRAFRNGQSFYRSVLRHWPLWKRLAWLSGVGVRAALESVALALCRPFSFSLYARILHLWSIHVGQLSMILGDRFVYSEYAPENYRTDH